MNANTEKIVALAALIGLFVFVGILVWFVREVDLVIVVVIGVVLASYDFVKTLVTKRETGD